MIRALLFDLDGTLTHTDPIHLRAFQQLLAEEGRTIDEAGFRTHVSGRSNREIGSRLFPGRRPDEHVVLTDRKEALFRELAGELTPITGVVGLLGWAKAEGLGLALVTNAPRANVSHMLHAIGLADAFDIIVHADELARPKPDPLPYATALHRLGVEAPDALAFEDSVPGIASAKAAGIVTVGIATTRTRGELREANADLAVADFDDPGIWSLVRQGRP